MTTTTVTVSVQGAPYNVVIGKGILEESGAAVRAVARGSKIALVSDSTVEHILGTKVATWLAMGGFDVYGLTIPAGEESKTWAMAGLLLEELARYGIGREDAVVALGGGVVGDLAGFAAATYLRGIQLIQVPTTLLAQVDSSVGGKTGVDLEAGKNLAGAFKQPSLVLADITTLKTLPAREWQSGLAEVAKSAILGGEEFLSWLEANAKAIADRATDVTEEAVRRCVEFKSSVVAADEHEAGPRECLNYGHTLGHSIERAAGYGALPHGLAVAEGMRFSARLAVKLGVADEAFAERQEALLDALGLAPLGNAYDTGALMSGMRGDKKSRGGSIRFVLVSAPGEWTCGPVAEDVLLAALEEREATKRRG